MFWLHFEVRVRHGGEGRRGLEAISSTVPNVVKQREMNAGAQLLSSFSSVLDPNPWDNVTHTQDGSSFL